MINLQVIYIYKPFEMFTELGCWAKYYSMLTAEYGNRNQVFTSLPILLMWDTVRYFPVKKYLTVKKFPS